MARVPAEELERLKAEVPLQRLVEAKGVELRRHGARDLIGCCPFHDDREPSLVVSPEKNLWHCMGACQAGGSVVDWVMRAEGVSFRHAVELLRADLPPEALAGKVARGESTVRRLPAPVAFDAEDGELLRQVVAYYHDTLRQSPEALEYLRRRGLGSHELVERFRLGFANRTLGLRLPESSRQAGGEIRSRLQRLGVVRASGHEHFNGCLVVPVWDEDGSISELYGRRLRYKHGAPPHLYLPGPHRGVWNVEAFASDGCEEVVLCEALLDALTCWALGFRAVTAAYGVEGFTDDHLAVFRRGGVRRVLIAYDRDAAGDKAAVQLAVRLVGAGLDCFRVQLPQGHDVNSFAAADWSTAQDRLARVVRGAVWLGQGRRPEGGVTGEPVAEAVQATPPDAAPSPSAAPTAPPLVVLPPPPMTDLDREDERDDAGAVEDDESPAPFAADDVPLAPPVEASPLPPAPTEELATEASEGEVVMQLGERRWRVRGLARNTSYDVLRVNLLVSRQPAAQGTAGFHVDTLDLYSARARHLFTKQAADELGVDEEVVKRDVGRVLLRLEALAEEAIRAAQEPARTVVSMSAEEEAEALELLRDPQLVERVVADFDRIGVVGEQTNKLVGYLAATSRKLDRPLAVIVQSSSAAGKSSLLEAVLAFMPEEERVKYSAMTGQSLFYVGENDLAHKILAVVEEEGAERAAYALKLLQSEGELSIASTGKDGTTGRLVTHEYRVSGPVAILLTTTAVDVDEELLNRCVVLSVDEDRVQTQAIHERQREAETLEGLLAAAERDRVIRVHRNAQRLLRPLLVANPFARQLRFADERTRSRRDHTKYLALIRTIALLHQHQRPVQTVRHGDVDVSYIEVTAADIAVANRLAHEVLGRSLDELPVGTRRLLLLLDEWVQRECEHEEMQRRDLRFTRRQVREWSGWGDTQLKVHLARLVDLEYLLVHRGGRGQSFVYELRWDGQGRDGQPVLNGLVDPATLCAEVDGHAYGAEWSGQEAPRSGSGRAAVGARSGGGRAALEAPKRRHSNRFPSLAATSVATGTVPGGNGAAPAVGA